MKLSWHAVQDPHEVSITWVCPVHDKQKKTILVHKEKRDYCVGCNKTVDNRLTTENWERQMVSLVGEASMCWDTTPTGVFDSDEAMQVAFSIVGIVKQKIEEAREEGQEQAAREIGAAVAHAGLAVIELDKTKAWELAVNVIHSAALASVLEVIAKERAKRHDGRINAVLSDLDTAIASLQAPLDNK